MLENDPTRFVAAGSVPIRERDRHSARVEIRPAIPAAPSIPFNINPDYGTLLHLRSEPPNCERGPLIPAIRTRLREQILQVFRDLSEPQPLPPDEAARSSRKKSNT